MSVEPLRAGIIGCGRIASNHAAALQAVDGVQLVAVADIDRGRAQALAERYGVPNVHTGLSEFFATGLDLVTICTPHRAHEEGVLAAARHGVHVLCEKPVAASLADARRMTAAAEQAGIRFGVLFQRRLWPASVRIRQAIDSGRLGTPISGGLVVRLNRDADYYAEPWRGRWDSEGGGVLMTQAIHHIDLLQWFMGPAVRVTGRYATLAHSEHIEVEDTAGAVVEFESGAIATLHAATTFSPRLGAQLWVSDVHGRTAGLMEFPEGVGFTDVWTLPGEEEFAKVYHRDGRFDIPLAHIHEHLVPYHTLQIQEFVDAVRSGRKPAVTGTEAVKSLEIVQAIYESSRTGRPVSVPAKDVQP